MAKFEGQGSGTEPASPKLASSRASEGRLYPALDVDGVDGDFLLALIDDFGPSALETNASTVTIFFPDTIQRDRARDAVLAAYPHANVGIRDVDDEDWARRSQQNLAPIRVGLITVKTPEALERRPSPSPSPSPFTIVIAPSMGFGTGHHATTRLCLEALQQLDLKGRDVLDVGTGSGILAIAARLLGAASVLGIDDDRDAIQAAVENRDRNQAAADVTFDVIDLRAASLGTVDVITANLTGALLINTAALLLNTLKPRGSLIVSGLQNEERNDVVGAFGRARIVWERSEDEWTGILFDLPAGR